MLQSPAFFKSIRSTKGSQTTNIISQVGRDGGLVIKFDFVMKSFQRTLTKHCKASPCQTLDESFISSIMFVQQLLTDARSLLSFNLGLSHKIGYDHELCFHSFSMITFKQQPVTQMHRRLFNLSKGVCLLTFSFAYLYSEKKVLAPLRKKLQRIVFIAILPLVFERKISQKLPFIFVNASHPFNYDFFAFYFPLYRNGILHFHFSIFVGYISYFGRTNAHLKTQQA